MPFRQVIIRAVANILFFLKKEEIKNTHLKFLIFTGTSGKTTMKDSVYATLSGLGITAERSIYGYNNELGIILTIIGISDFSVKKIQDWLRALRQKVEGGRFICIELGADFYEDTDWFLSKFSPYGVFISSSDPSSWSHDISHVERNRKKLFAATLHEGFIAYNYDDVTVKKLIQESNAQAKLISFSTQLNSQAFVSLESWENPFMSFPVDKAVKMYDELTIKVGTTFHRLELSRAIFEPQVYGVLASYACMYHISGMNLEKISRILDEYQFSENRLQIYLAKNGAVVIEDSYKATPLCTSWYLDMASRLHAQRKILIMTEMRPLTYGINDHYEHIGQQSLCADQVFFLGPERLLTILHNSNKGVKGITADEYMVLGKDLLTNSRQGDVVLLKGSLKYNLPTLRSMLV